MHIYAFFHYYPLLYQIVKAYESQSSGILDTISDMQEKAEASLSSTRKDEMEAAHAYAMLKQGLEDEIKVNKKQLGEATLTRSASSLLLILPRVFSFGFPAPSLFAEVLFFLGLRPRRSFTALRPRWWRRRRRSRRMRSTWPR